MSVYQIEAENPVTISLEERHDEVQVFSYQKVIDHSKLVEGIYRGWNAQFGNDIGVFSRGNLDSNFAQLRKMSGLLSQKEHVSSLISGFTITIAGKMEYIDVGPGKYKVALFIHWLANSGNTFDMDDEKRKLTWAYFGNKICMDAITDEHTEHTIVRMLLAEGGTTITVDSPEAEIVEWTEGSSEVNAPVYPEEYIQ